jgi:hypothetical protein
VYSQSSFQASSRFGRLFPFVIVIKSILCLRGARTEVPPALWFYIPFFANTVRQPDPVIPNPNFLFGAPLTQQAEMPMGQENTWRTVRRPLESRGSVSSEPRFVSL